MKFDGRADQLEMLREIADNIPEPVFLVDRGFNVWYFNRAFEQAVGVRMNSKRYKDRPCYELLGLSVCKNDCVMKNAVANNHTVNLAEIPGNVAGGELKNFNINAIPVQNAQGTPFGALIFLRDVTAETQMQEKYKQLVAKNSAISLSGNIEGGNVVDVLQLFIFLQKSGQLSFKRPGFEGAIVFERGQMIAIFAAQGRNERALDMLLGLPDGEFSFSPKLTVTVEERLSGSSDFMLMNAVRERDELGARRHLLPDVATKPTVLRIANPEADELNGPPWQIYELAMEGKSIEQMLQILPNSETRILNAVLSLKEKQILSW